MRALTDSEYLMLVETRELGGPCPGDCDETECTYLEGDDSVYEDLLERGLVVDEPCYVRAWDCHPQITGLGCLAIRVAQLVPILQEAL
jgi:hypothetical protein